MILNYFCYLESLKIVKVLLADSSELIQKGLENILASKEFVSKFSTVTSSETLLESKDIANADVLIIDFMSEGFSIDSVSLAAEKMKSPNILAITSEQSAMTIVNAMKAGVRSYVKKSCSAKEILEAVESTAKSEAFFCGQIVEAIQSENIKIEDLSGDTFTCEPIKLSARELEIIQLIAEGHTNTQIASKLFLSAHTINTVQLESQRLQALN